MVNGLLVSRLKVPPFIGTLGMFGVARGVAFLLAGGTTVPVKQLASSRRSATASFFGVPYIVIITAVFVLLMHYLLSQTRFGQHNYAIGANVQAARRAGIDIKSHLLRLYILSAMLRRVWPACSMPRASAPARRRRASRCCSTRVAAVVIGGASLFGGSGTILGTVAGALRDRGHPVRAGLHQRRAVLAVHQRRRRHHHLGPDRPGAAAVQRRSAE